MLLFGKLLNLFVFCISRMAAIPKGVAALPSPNMFAVILALTAFIAGLSGLYSGIIFDSNGDIAFEIFSVIPLLSAIFIMPVQRHITPAIDIISLTALSAPSRMLLDKFSILPVHNAQIKLIITIKNHI